MSYRSARTLIELMHGMGCSFLEISRRSGVSRMHLHRIVERPYHYIPRQATLNKLQKAYDERIRELEADAQFRAQEELGK